MQARYAILRVLLAASEKDTSGGAPFLQVKDSRSEFKGKDSPDLEVHLLSFFILRQLMIYYHTIAAVAAVQRLMKDVYSCLHDHKPMPWICVGEKIFKFCSIVQLYNAYCQVLECL